MSESMAPPVRAFAPVQWVRNNLFNTWYNILLTLVVGYLLVTSLWPLLNWAFFDANFAGESLHQRGGLLAVYQSAHEFLHVWLLSG